MKYVRIEDYIDDIKDRAEGSWKIMEREINELVASGEMPLSTGTLLKDRLAMIKVDTREKFAKIYKVLE